MARQFVFLLAGIVVVMAVLIALPSLSRQPSPESLSIEYSKQHVARVDQRLVTQSAELLSINEDGSATYTGTDVQQRRVSISAEEIARIRALILETGFIQISTTNYPQSDDADNFTRHTLRVRTDDGQKTFNWVDPEAHNGTIPPIILNIGSHFDAIIDRI